MLPETKKKMYVLTIGEFSVTILTIIVMLGFNLESGFWKSVRNVFVVDLLFLLVFLLILRVFRGYERLYKFGLGPEE